MPFNYPNQPPIDYINPPPIYGRSVSVNSFRNYVDVLIVGAGPTGLMAANALSSFGVNVRIIDQCSQNEFYGRATGVQPQTIEMLQCYGLASRLLREGNQLW